MNNRIVYSKSCLGCKLVAGSLFTVLGSYHAYRVYTGWNFYPRREKIFNIFATAFVFALAGANFNAAYETYLGKTLQLVEIRPSLLQRLQPNNGYLTPK